MTYGKLKLVDNRDPRMGSAFRYWFLKVRSGPAEWQEEYWLVTEQEADRFAARSIPYPRTVKLGYIYPVLARLDMGYGTESLLVRHPTAGDQMWAVTPTDIERIRRRSEKNGEDLEANRESWLADFLD